MFKKMSVLIFIFTLMIFPQFSYADWFDDLWEPGGTLYWLRMGSDPPGGITELDPDNYYFSSDFPDQTIKSNEYLKREEIGVNIDTESFINQGYIRVFSEAETNDGIYNGSEGQIYITNSGNIYVGSDTSDTNSYGMDFEIDLYNSNIINSGNILSEVNFSNIPGYANSYGIYFYGDLENSSISNSGTLAAKVKIDSADYAYGDAYGIYTDYLTNSEINNSGNILAEVSLSNVSDIAEGKASGIETYSIEGSSSITNSGSITSRVKIDIADYAYGDAYGIYTDYITNSEINNSGNILAEVSLSNVSDIAGERHTGLKLIP